MNCSKVKRINKIGKIPCLDITVDSKNHIFYANGIATSNSHSLSYAKLAYATAYMKVHFPLHFFASSLYWAKEKIDEKQEISELVYEAKKFNIDIRPPYIQSSRIGMFGFNITDKKIYFGLSNVKGIGESACKKLLIAMEDAENLIGKAIVDFTWMEIIIFICSEVNTTLMKNAISVGFFDYFKLTRQKMLFDYDIWSKINEHEQKAVKSNFKKISRIEDCLDLLCSLDKKDGGPKTENRRKLIADLKKLCESPPFSLYDNRESISKMETELMGVTLTASMLEGADTTNADTTCKEYSSGKTGSCSIAVSITRVNEYIIKKGKQVGQKMGALSAQDDTGKISSILIFAEAWEANKDKLYVGAQVILHGQKSKQNDSFLVSKVRSI